MNDKSLSDKSFLDTNILVYAYDSAAGIRHERAKALLEQLWSSGQGVLSTQILQELCVSLQRKVARPLSLAETRRIVQPYLAWEVVVNTPLAAIEALVVASRYQVSYWDGLVLHAAEAAGAVVLYSEDFSHGQKYGSVRVVNPFHE